jgi:hypothetical protein
MAPLTGMGVGCRVLGVGTQPKPNPSTLNAHPAVGQRLRCGLMRRRIRP